MLSNALIQKGLRPQAFVGKVGTASAIQCPDSKGIKTLLLCAHGFGVGAIQCPDSKGIKTFNIRLTEPQNGVLSNALIQKGLRLCRVYDQTLSAVLSNALIQKGLRPFQSLDPAIY